MSYNIQGTMTGRFPSRQRRSDIEALLAWRAESGLDPEERRRRKAVTHAFIYRAGPLQLAKFGSPFLLTHELVMDSIPLHRRPLDAGDKLFMEWTGMNELQYRDFLYTAELRELLDDPPFGQHYDKVVVDDRPIRSLNKPPALGEPYMRNQYAAQTIGQPGDCSNQARIPSPTSATPLESQLSLLSAQIDRVQAAYKEQQAARSRVEGTSPLDASYISLVMQLHQSTTYLLSCMQDYLKASAISLGIPN